MRASDPTGLHRVLDDRVVLPQAADRLDTRKELWPDEVRIRVERLNLDAASFRQLERTHHDKGDGDGVRRAVLEIVAARGKMQNPETGSGGMLVGTVEEVGPESPLGLAVGDRVATLVSLTLTPLVIEDGLARWDGRSEQVPCDGYAVLFGRSIAARIPDDLPADLSLAVMDVCGAPALTHRVVAQYEQGVVAVIGGAGKSGSLSLAAARNAGAQRTVGVVPNEHEAALLRESGIADDVVVADARDPIALRDAVIVGSRADGRRHRGLRRRARLRGRRDPGHLTEGHGHLLLDGDVVLVCGAGRGGAGRRRDDAGRQRLRPRARRLRHAAAPRAAGRPRPVRAAAGGLAVSRRPTGKLDLDPVTVRKARTLARKAGKPIVDLAKRHTTVSVERATLRMAGLAGADGDGIPWANRLLDVVRADVGLEHGVALPVWDALVRGEAEDLATLAQKAGAGSVTFHVPDGPRRSPGPGGRSQARRGRAQADRRPATRARADDQEAR